MYVLADNHRCEPLLGFEESVPSRILAATSFSPTVIIAGDHAAQLRSAQGGASQNG
jgi:hypothetical protein